MNMKVNRSATIKRIVTFFCLVAVLEAGGVATAFLWQHHDGREAAAQAAESTNSPPFFELADRAVDEGELTAQTAQIIGKSSNLMSVYFLRPDKEIEPFIYNRRQMAPASMIKLFVMAKVMQDVHDGKLSLDEKLTIKKKDVVGGAGVTTWYDAGQQRTIQQLVNVMITDSDNTATNMLIDRIGIKAINDYLKQYGFYDTVLNHKLMVGGKGANNLSSVRDIGHLLSRIYYHQLVGPAEDKAMLEILQRQQDKECLPNALPGYSIAHKSGEVSGVYADGGVCFGPQGDFILVMLNNGREGRGETIATMQKLAKYYAGTMEK